MRQRTLEIVLFLTGMTAGWTLATVIFPYLLGVVHG